MILLALLLSVAFLDEFTSHLAQLSCEDAHLLYIERVGKVFASATDASEFRDLFCRMHKAVAESDYPMTDFSFSEEAFEVARVVPETIPLEDLHEPAEPLGDSSSDIDPSCRRGLFNLRDPFQDFTDTLPASYDFREIGLQTGALAQGNVGSCWAFASTALLETLILRDAPNYRRDPNYATYFDPSAGTLSLSRQFLLNRSQIICGGSCFYVTITRYVTNQIPTVELTSNFPYTSGTGSCPKDHIISPEPKLPEKSYLKPFRIVRGDAKCNTGYFYAGSYDLEVLNDNQRLRMKTLLARGIPISTGVFTGAAGPESHLLMTMYTGGLMRLLCANLGLNHGAVYVGYGKYDGIDVWVLRNTWGDWWGVQGYYYTIMGENILCSEMMVVEFAAPKYLGFDTTKVFYPYANSTLNYFDDVVRGKDAIHPSVRGLDPDPTVTCDEGTFKMGSLCLKCEVRNCVECNSWRCKTCVPGYKRRGSVCVQNTVANCAVEAIYSENCRECIPGYTLTDNKCIGTPLPNCILQTKDKKCSQCYLDHVLTDGACVLKVIPNCLKMNALGLCYECNPEYSLNDGECKWKLIYKCDYMSSETVCGRCVQGFSKNPKKNNKCSFMPVKNCNTYTRDLVCDTCLPGFVLNKAANTCDLPMKPNCIQQNTEGVCLSCKDEYYLDTKDECVKGTILDCIYYSREGACTSCSNAMAIQNGRCAEPVTPGCFAMDEKDICTQCYSEYVILSKKCVAAVDNCAEYSLGGCVNCMDTYAYQDGKCVATPIIGCIVLSDKGECMKCKEGLVIMSAVCDIPRPKCTATIKAALGRQCISCEAGYTLSTTDYQCLPTSAADPTAPCLTKGSTPVAEFVPNKGLFLTYYTPENCVVNSETVNLMIDGTEHPAQLYDGTVQLRGATHVVFYAETKEIPDSLTIEPVVSDAEPITVPTDDIAVAMVPPTVNPPVDPPIDPPVIVKNGLSSGAIVGIVIVVLAVLAGVAVGVYFTLRRRQRIDARPVKTANMFEESIDASLEGSTRNSSAVLKSQDKAPKIAFTPSSIRKHHGADLGN